MHNPIETQFQSHLASLLDETTYENKRAQLLADEKSKSWDAKARQNATSTEHKAAAVLQSLRRRASPDMCGAEAAQDTDINGLGEKFLVNVDSIQSSDLFRVFRRMPKGANLHLHLNAALPPKHLIVRARNMTTMFIRSTQPLLKPSDFDHTEVVFTVLPADTPHADIFSAAYNPDPKSETSQPWMSWIKFRHEFANHHPGDAEDFILQKLVLAGNEVYDKNQTVHGIWARFNQATRCFKGLFNYESAYRWYMGAIAEHFIEDRIMYAELRPMLLDKSIPTDDGLGKLSHADQMRILLEEVAKVQQKHSRQVLPFGLKVIYCAPRSIPKKTMQTELLDCISLKLAFPNLICGFDLVGAEDRPNSIHYYHAELLAFQQTCASLGLDIPFLFHAGETLLDTGGSRDPNESNLYDAYLLESKRIGHGVALLRHDYLLDEFRKQDIAIEVCMISNEILHLCSNAKEHDLPQLLAEGLHCVIASDNPSLFSSSLSHDFYQVFAGSVTMNLHGLRQLVEWSIQYSCLSLAEKEEAFGILKVEWEDFCHWLVGEFPND